MQNKYYLITGASSGIGKAAAIALSKQGAKCVMVARDPDKLNEVRSALENAGEHTVIPYDLLDMDHYGDIFNKLKNEGICLSGMVHCAGITRVTPLRTISTSQALDLFNIHYFAFLELDKRYEKKGLSCGGSVVGISAINAHVPQKCMTVYASAKSALESACRTLSVELAEKNIRNNSIVVGGISGGMGGDIHEAANVAQTIVVNKAHDEYVNPVSRQLLGIGSPDAIANVIVFMLSEQASFITGREIYADGGLL